MDAKDTNRGKGCSGNVCYGGHTPFAALAHTDRRVLATNNPPLLLKRSSFLADWLRCRPVWLPLRSKLKFRKARALPCQCQFSICPCEPPSMRDDFTCSNILGH